MQDVEQFSPAQHQRPGFIMTELALFVADYFDLWAERFMRGARKSGRRIEKTRAEHGQSRVPIVA